MEQKTVTVQGRDFVLEHRTCIGGCGIRFWVQPESNQRRARAGCEEWCHLGMVSNRVQQTMPTYAAKSKGGGMMKISETSITNFNKVLAALREHLDNGGRKISIKAVAFESGVGYQQFQNAKASLRRHDPRLLKPWEDAVRTMEEAEENCMKAMLDKGSKVAAPQPVEVSEPNPGSDYKVGDDLYVDDGGLSVRDPEADLRQKHDCPPGAMIKTLLEAEDSLKPEPLADQPSVVTTGLDRRIDALTRICYVLIPYNDRERVRILKSAQELFGGEDR